MALASLGIKKTEEALLKALKTTSKKGTHSSMFSNVAEKYNLTYFVERGASITDLKAYLKSGFRIIVGYFYAPEDIGHYAVVKDIDKKNIYLLDPYLGPNHFYTIKEFQKLWTKGFKYERSKRWLFGVKK